MGAAAAGGCCCSPTRCSNGRASGRWATRCARRRRSPTPGCWGIGACGSTRRTSAGRKLLKLGGKDVLTASPGSLFGGCAISKDRLVARCRIGKGSATIIADADFLNVDDLDGPTADNLNGLLAELATLDQR